MTDETREPTPDQLAAEPAPVALRALAFTPAAQDALAQRIEAAAAAELARRALAHAGHTSRAAPYTAARAAPRRPARATWARPSAAGDVAPLLARALRPAMLAAAAAAVLAVGLAGDSAGSGDTGVEGAEQVSDASAVQALNLHDPNAQWPDQARAPSADALGRAIGLGGAP